MTNNQHSGHLNLLYCLIYKLMEPQGLIRVDEFVKFGPQQAAMTSDL